MDQSAGCERRRLRRGNIERGPYPKGEPPGILRKTKHSAGGAFDSRNRPPPTGGRGLSGGRGARGMRPRVLTQVAPGRRVASLVALEPAAPVALLARLAPLAPSHPS